MMRFLNWLGVLWHQLFDRRVPVVQHYVDAQAEGDQQLIVAVIEQPVPRSRLTRAKEWAIWRPRPCSWRPRMARARIRRFT